jgi:aminoglycoside phosphotransferase (APT) family kinase protein
MTAVRPDPTTAVTPTDESVRAWLTDNMGEVASLTRQPRWRPVWFAEVERDGRRLDLCVRGDRADTTLTFPLEHEMTFQRVLFEHGIPVPEVHGWSESPRFYVMDRIEGVPDFTHSTDAERRSVVDQYLQILARMHALDIQPFADAGITRAARPQDSALPGMAAFEAIYRSQKLRPDPLMEWVLGWLHRHPLDNPTGREAPIVWDSGQFLHQNGQLTALMDLELGHIGDPMMDLAGWRMRDTIMNYGDFTELYARYGELRGEPVDLDAIRHHHVAFTLSNQLSFHGALAAPPLESAYMTNLQWCTETNVMVVEALAEKWGVELEQLPTSESDSSPVAAAHAHLVASLRHFPATDEQGAYAARLAFRLARHLQRFDEIGHTVVQADLDDLEPLLGWRPRSWQQGEQGLEDYVVADDGAHDRELLGLFNRRTQRAQMLLGPVGSAMVTHHRVQPFAPTTS